MAKEEWLINSSIVSSSSAPASVPTGTIRHNTHTGFVEIHDGTKWKQINSNMWDFYEPSEELTDAELCEKHPALRELKNNLKEAQEKYDAFRELCREKRNEAN